MASGADFDVLEGAGPEASGGNDWTAGALGHSSGPGGAAGLDDVLKMLKTELAFAMSLSGRPTIADIDDALIIRPS